MTIRELLKHTLFYLAIIYSPNALSVNLFDYSNAVIFRDDLAFCHGVMIDNKIITAGHCLVHGGNLSIGYLSDKTLVRSPSIGTDFTYVKDRLGQFSDLGIIYTKAERRADIDGRLAIDPGQKIEKYRSKSQFYLDVLDKTDDDQNTRTRIDIAYDRTTDQRMRFRQVDPPKISRPSTRKEGLGYFSLSMSNTLSYDKKDLICQGKSGAPIFAEYNGMTYFIAIMIQGRTDSHLDGLSCGVSFYGFRLDMGGSQWILDHLNGFPPPP